MGYLPAVFIAGYISEKTGKRLGYDILAMICASVVLYACGVTWLKILTGMTWSKTMMVGMYPFLVGDALKIVAAALIARALRPIIRVPGCKLRVPS
jgi:biotin transport system substrate-specific component